MVKTGGTLSAKMIELIGHLNEDETEDNVKSAIKKIEEKLAKGGDKSKIRLYVELFGRVDDISADIRDLQKKLDKSSSINNIVLGVELGDLTVPDFNKQVGELSKKFKKAKTSENFQLDIEFDFKGSASKIKEEMKEIQKFMETFGNITKKTEADVRESISLVESTITGLGKGTDHVSSQIENHMRDLTDSTGKFSLSYERDMKGAIEGANASLKSADGTVEQFKYILDEAGTALGVQSRKTKIAGDATERYEAQISKVRTAQENLNKAIERAPEGFTSDSIAKSQKQIDLAEASLRRHGKATEDVDKAMRTFGETLRVVKSDVRFGNQVEDLKGLNNEFSKLSDSGKEVERFNDRIVELGNRSEESFTSMGTTSQKEFQKLKNEIEESIDVAKRLDTELSNAEGFKSAVEQGDINTLKSYVEEMKGGTVQTLRMTDARNKDRGAVKRLTANMEEQNGVIQTYTLEYDKADGSIRQTKHSSKELASATKELDGTFSGVIAKMTQYFSAIKVLQKGMQTIKKTITEILNIDTQMIELARVADPSLNLDVILERSIGLSKELGANVSSVVGVVGDMARTFGEFNEEQLLAITRTATIMQNVSELNLEESSGTLVGTMKAFNIEAEDSVRIIDSFNEVDNNFAISTRQISEAMERAGATAQTFGIDMEHLIGDITAVGEVTQESGKRIGTALRTIYSRITTHDKAVEALDDLGIAMREMGDSGPQLRSVSDILGDLGGMWGDLNNEQQQNIALNIAGRNRLTQFLALMNNQSTAVNATTTAYNSQGSAMREQREYMESYEYRMTVLGATATDVALTIEDKFVGDAMYAVVTASTEFLEVLDRMIDRFGFLPTVLTGVTSGLFLLNSNFRELTTEKIPSLLGKAATSLVDIATGAGNAGTAVAGMLGALGKGAIVATAVFAVAKAVEWLVKKLTEAKRANEEAKHSMEEAIKIYNEQGNEIESLIDRYEELHDAQLRGELDTDSEREYLDIVNKISTMLPNAVSHVDSKGQAHLRNADAIREQAGAMEDLAKANALAMREEHDEAFDNIVGDLADAQERYRVASEKADKSYKKSKMTYEEYQQSIGRAIDTGDDQASTVSKQAFEMNVLTSATEEYYKQSSITNANTFEQSALIQEVTAMIGDQTIAYMYADGQAKNLTTTSEALIREYASMNNQIIENAKGEKELSEARETLTDDSMKFGKIMSDIYDDIAQGLDDVDAEKAIDQFDQLLNALPREEFEKGFGEIEQNLGSLQAVIGDVSSGAEVDIDKIIKALEGTGMEGETARSVVIALADAFDHQQIQAEVAEGTITEYNDELVRTKELTLDLIDPMEMLFGYDSDDLKAMESHLVYLRLLKNEYGDTWSEMDRGQESIEAIADYFNISTDAVVENFEKFEDFSRIIGSAGYKFSEETRRNELVFDDSVTSAEEKFARALLSAGDGYTGLVDGMILDMEIVNIAQDDMSQKAEEMGEKLKDLLKAPSDIDARNNLMNLIRDDLGDIRGAIAYVEDDLGNIKLIMADGSSNEYLDVLNEQLEETRLALRVDDSDQDNIMLMIENLDTNDLKELVALNDLAIEGKLSLEKQAEAMRALVSEATSDEQRETFVEILGAQMSAFGDEIELVEDKTEGLKIQLEGHEDNPWLVALNDLVKELGVRIEEVEDDAGDLQVSFMTKEGETFFTTSTIEVGNLNEKIKETTESVDELTDPEKENKVKIDFDEEPVDKGIERTERTLDAVFGKDREMKLVADNTDLIKTVEESNEESEKLEDKTVKFEVDESSLKNMNDVRREVKETEAKIQDLESALSGILKDLTVTNKGMEGLMTNTKNINSAHSEIKNLIGVVDDAIDKMGDLYAMFSSDKGIDTTGIENSAEKIAEEASKIENAIIRMQDYITSMNLSLKGMDTDFDTTSINNYRASILENAHLIASDISALATVVSRQMDNISEAYGRGNINLELLYNETRDILGKMTVFHRLAGEIVVEHSENTSVGMLENYNNGLIGILRVVSTFKDLMDRHFKEFYKSMVDKVTMTVVDMRTVFTNGTNDIVRVAEGLPRRIGQGIRNNISQATGSMTVLANSMITRFKRELGIHSPSRVFTELGGDVIDGLVNGLTGSEITNVGRNVFSDFSDGAISTINEIKGYMTFEPVSASSFGAGFSKTSGFGPRRSPGGIGSTNHKGVDYGAPAGTPIPSQSSGVVTASGYHGTMGNFIKIRSGDGHEHIYMHNSMNNVGVGQTVGRGQTIGLVGSTGNSTGPHVHYEVRVNGVPIDPEKRFRGFAEGGFVDEKELAWHGEEGLEAIIPLVPERRDRGLDLWKQSGEILGMDSGLLDMLVGVSGDLSSGISPVGFSSLDGESGEGDSDTGTTGTIRGFASSIADSLGIGRKAMFTSLDDEVKLEDLYKSDYDAIKTSMQEDLVTKANIRLKELTEQTLAYRNALELVSKQERELRKHTKAMIKKTLNRQKAIHKELKTLRNTSKHTEEQRKKYNELKKEYDDNTQSILTMENSVRELNIALDERKLQKYTDRLEEMSNQYVYLAGSIERTISQSEFYLRRVELLDSEDINRQLIIKNDILKQTMELEKKLELQQSIMRLEYEKTMDEYGARSEEALRAREKMIEIEDRYRESVIDRIEKEKELYEIRRDQLATQHEYIAGSIDRTIAKSEFNLKKIELLLGKNINKQLEIKNEIINQTINLEAKLRTQQILMEREYKQAMEEYGSRSEEALEARKNLIKVEDDYRNAVISRIEKEKEIGDIRRDIAREGVDAVKDYYEQTQSMTEKAIDLERKALEKAHSEKMDRYDEEIRKIESVYDAKVKELDDSRAEDSYQEEMAELNEKRAQLSADISRVSRDTSLEGRKRVAELQEELKSVNEEVRKTQEQRQDELYRQAIEQQKREQLDRIEMEKEASDRSHNSRMEELEKQLEESKREIESILRDDRFWHDMIEDFAEGSTDQLDRMISEAQDKMYQFLSGDFGGIDNSLTAEDREVFEEDVLIDISNSLLRFSDSIEEYISATSSFVSLAPSLSTTSSSHGGIKPVGPSMQSFSLDRSKVDDVLNIESIVERLKGAMPRMRVDTPHLKNEKDSRGGDTYNLDNLILSIEDFEGSGEDVQRLFDNMANELKKKGRR